jgi:hypothetical protein
MTGERIDGPPTITLDDAQAAVIEALKRAARQQMFERLPDVPHEMTRVEDVGADCFERCVSFTLALPDGTRKTFVATIKEWGEGA